jgi:hypothetical protein
MKKLCLFLLVVLLLPVTSSFAITPPTATGQQIFIPYAIVGNGWWSGVAITNTSASTMTFSIGVFKENGGWVAGSSFSVPPHAMKVEVLEYFFGNTPPDVAMSVRIRTTTNEPFKATLFIGTDQGGFGFQNYNSGDYTYNIILAPGD